MFPISDTSIYFVLLINVLGAQSVAGEGTGLLRLHSTYRHDLKIYSSDEGRVQVASIFFCERANRLCYAYDQKGVHLNSCFEMPLWHPIMSYFHMVIVARFDLFR